VLIDADPLGGGIDLAIASEGVAGATWADFADRSGRLPAATLTGSLPQRHGVHVLTHPRSHSKGVTSTSAAIVIDAARRAFNVVVIDIARTPDAVGRVGWSVADLALVVTPRDVRSLAAASASLDALPGGLPLRLITRGPAPGGLGAHDAARILGYSAVIEWPYDKTLPGSFERGIAPGSSARSVHARAAAQLLADVLAPTQAAA
jgi:secretion/DNA translocation related CpaE-like protein